MINLYIAKQQANYKICFFVVVVVVGKKVTFERKIFIYKELYRHFFLVEI